MKKLGLLFIGFASLALLACGGGDDDGAKPDARVIDIPDANTTPPDAPGQACTVNTAGYGDLGNIDGDMLMLNAEINPQDDQMPMGPQYIFFGVALNQDPQPDAIIFSLWENFGAFTGTTFATATYPVNATLTGAEADWWNCGACAEFWGDFVSMQGPTQRFQASAGMMVIDEITLPNGGTPGRLRGSATNVMYQHIDPGDMPPQTVINDGCNTSVTSVTWSVPLVAGM